MEVDWSVPCYLVQGRRTAKVRCLLPHGKVCVGNYYFVEHPMLCSLRELRPVDATSWQRSAVGSPNGDVKVRRRTMEHGWPRL